MVERLVLADTSFKMSHSSLQAESVHSDSKSPTLMRRLVVLSCKFLGHRYYFRELRGKVDLVCRRCGNGPLSSSTF